MRLLSLQVIVKNTVIAKREDMKVSVSFKNIVVEVICVLFILLFVYAAISKLLDFENFQVQIAQSPLLSSFANWISYLVPLLEIIIAGFLCTQKVRLIALYAAFGLMIMFTVYIFIILNFSPFVPCSCGGILEKLTWTQHLIFNILFCVVALLAILIETNTSVMHPNYKRPIIILIGVSLSSTAILLILFFISEDMMHNRNNFTRRFPVHPAEFLKDYKLDTPAPYLAGSYGEKVYVGDNRDPLTVLEVDVNLKTITSHTISTNEPNRPFRSLRIIVKPPYFYLSDGLEAFAFRGSIADWKAEIWINNIAYYNSFVPLDYERAAIRSLVGVNSENIIGIMKHSDTDSVIFNEKLLDKQIDGVFDTDGKLLFNEKHKSLIYVYTYRNEFLITDLRLQSKIIGKTIDTTSRAKIKVAYVDNNKTSKLASPARVVNKTSATFGDFLFVNSKLIGQYEQKDIWDEASIIDVYNIVNHAYLFSFYLYDKEGHKISDFIVDSNKIYTLAGKTLTVYHLDPIPFLKNN